MRRTECNNLGLNEREVTTKLAFLGLLQTMRRHAIMYMDNGQACLLDAEPAASAAWERLSHIVVPSPLVNFVRVLILLSKAATPRGILIFIAGN